MSTTTFTAFGTKMRTQSCRRLVIIAQISEYSVSRLVRGADGKMTTTSDLLKVHAPFIARRSDDFSTAMTAAKRIRAKGSVWGSQGTTITRVEVIDTSTGESLTVGR